MANCPYIDHILIDDRPSFLNIITYINLYKKIAHQNFKIIYDLQNSQKNIFYRKYLFNEIRWIFY